MDRHTPVFDFIADISSHKDMEESSWNHGEGGVSASMLPYSSTIAALGEDDDYFQNAAIYPMIQDPRDIELENSKCLDQEIAGESQGLERRGQNVGHQPKQKRCGKTHTISERRRRERIRAKIQALQELIPYSNKWDKALVLDEAINYIKSLKLQVEMMMSMGGGGALFLSPVGIRFSQVVSELPLVMQMRGGMVGMYFSTVPTSPMSLPAGTISFCFPHVQLPVPAAATQTMLPNFVTPAVFNYSSQGESTSQNIDCQQMPITNQHKRRDPPMEETEYQNA